MAEKHQFEKCTVFNDDGELAFGTAMASRPPCWELDDETRLSIYHALLSISNHGVLPRGAINDFAKKYNLSRSTVSRLLSRAQKAPDDTSLSDLSRMWLPTS